MRVILYHELLPVNKEGNKMEEAEVEIGFFLPPAYVVWREVVFTGVCLSNSAGVGS